VEGWIERVDLKTAHPNQINQSSLSSQLAFYQSHGIWQDALNSLGVRYRDNLQDVSLQEDWIDLLTSAGLEDLATEGFVEP